MIRAIDVAHVNLNARDHARCGVAARRGLRRAGHGVDQRILRRARPVPRRRLRQLPRRRRRPRSRPRGVRRLRLRSAGGS